MTKPAKKSRSRPTGRGVLVILALFLASSGVLRIGAEFGVAMARTAEAEATETPAAPLNCPPPPIAVVEALKAREAQIMQSEAALADRMAALALADQAIDERLNKLRSAEEKLSETLSQASGAAEGDLARLTEMYQSMKPKDAAAIFAQMAPKFASGFLGRMRPDAAGAILAGLPSDSAYEISVLLASRNADVPKK